MTRVVNYVGVALAVVLAALSGIRLDTEPRPRVALARTKVEYVTMPGGAKGLKDVDGIAVPVRKYQRIASGSTIVDAMLLEFVEPERIVSFTKYSEQNPMWAHRYAGKPQLGPLDDLEALLALKPDLLLMNTHGSLSRVTRLREASVPVFSLGEMRGMRTFLNNVRTIAALLDIPEQGERYARAFRRRMASVAPNVRPSERPGALYLAIYGGQLYSSGSNTSYNDVMTYAGLRDIGAEHFDGWPELTPPKLLELDPQLIITRDNMRQVICSHVGLEQLGACGDSQHRIVELPGPLLSDPGPGMLVATEALYDAVHGRHSD